MVSVAREKAYVGIDPRDISEIPENAKYAKYAFSRK